ncbi:pyruvate, phosphate dikinase [Cellulomonas sp. H30R-01]|uniref:PEP/pyruvate-binding domain-containing protein n=1 Tax=Cellulomonas sp. H30R-01 TaxID=2704467 RepID=UPI00138BDE53|nr:PEP/pyruvate-binding domain-containing protein [Cellulomonas sp. H30R-01]QHT57900.1 pyruvate, phosphate dikinase [Cellulomonas sp. H30R-01]
MLVPLTDASARTCGGKAGALGDLLRAGLAVPDGWAVPLDVYRSAVRDASSASETRRNGPAAIADRPVPADVRAALADAVATLGGAPVVVRSSASDEDAHDGAAAGLYTSTLAVRGVDAVVASVRACWVSLHADPAVAYRAARRRDADPAMGVVVQRHVDADVSGVMFTPARPDGPTRIDASWGLGPSVVEGAVNPDAYTVGADGSVDAVTAEKRTRLDRRGDRLVTRDVPAPGRHRRVLDDTDARRLADLGRVVGAALGGAQDVEWAIADGQVWILQARPVTADLPPATPPSPTVRPAAGATVLTGAPGSRGTATGPARVVRDPGDFVHVRRGDVLVCPWTDPGWTPLLRVVGGVVTETGGVLSHAAIVARELGIPAVLGVPDATLLLGDASLVTVDGSAGTVTRAVG